MSEPRLLAVLTRPWPGGLLALANDDARVHLPAIAAAATFLTCLALALALAATSLADRWQGALSEALTVEIAPRQDLDAVTAKALTLLRGLDGVATAEPLPRARLRALLAPWLGEGAIIDGLPLPALIDVRLTRGAKLDTERVERLLAREIPGARLDDHRMWRDSVTAAAWLATAVAAAMLIAVLAAAVSAVVFATRARLAVHRDHIEILHVMGALDRTIAREFAVDAARLAAVGGLLGLALAFGLMAALAAFATQLETSALPIPRLSPLHWILVLVPLPVGALLAGLTAAIAAIGVLRRMP